MGEAKSERARICIARQKVKPHPVRVNSALHRSKNFCALDRLKRVGASLSYVKRNKKKKFVNQVIKVYEYYLNIFSFENFIPKILLLAAESLNN